MMTINENREKIAVNNEENNFNNILFRDLAIVHSIFTALAVVNLLAAFFLRRQKTNSIGVMLPFSVLMVFVSLLISALLFILVFDKVHFDSFAKWWAKTFSSSRVVAGTVVVFIELFLLAVVAIFTIKSLLLQPLYIGLTPGLFLLLTQPLSSLILLLKYDKRFGNFVRSIFSLPLQQALLFFGSLVGYAVIGFFLLQQFSLLHNGSTEILSSNPLISSILRFAFIAVFVDVVFLINAFLPNPKKFSALFDSSAALDDRNDPFSAKTNYLLRPIFISFIITLVFSVTLIALFRIRYDTNDDIQMISILSGYLGGTPSAFSVFGNVILGFLFQALFRLRTDVNWVTYFYLLINFLSIWSLVYCVLSLRTPKLYKYLGALIVLLFDCYYLSILTYTTVAATACLAGLCLLFNSIKTKNRRGPLISGILLVLIGSLIRPEAILLVIVLFVPYLMLNLKQLVSRKNITALLLLVFLVLGGYAFNSLYLHGAPEWAAFENYIKARQALIDTPRMITIPNDSPVYGTVSWSKNDVLAFLNGITLDKNVFSQETLQSLVNRISNWQTDFSHIFDQLFTSSATGADEMLLLLTCAVWLLFLLSIREKHSLLASLFSLIELVVILFVLVWGYKTPTRVVVPLYMTFSLVTLLMVDWPGSQKNEIVDGHKSIKIFYLPAFLMLLCISLGVGLTVNMFSENLRIDKAGENIYATINSDVAGLIKSGDIQSNALIISAADGYPFQLMSPLQLEFPPLQVLPLGWNAFSPAYDSVLARYGIDSIDKALLTRPDVYMVSRKDFIPVVTRFYKEHENIEVSVKEIYVLGGPIYAAQNSNNLILYHLVAH